MILNNLLSDNENEQRSKSTFPLRTKSEVSQDKTLGIAVSMKFDVFDDCTKIVSAEITSSFFSIKQCNQAEARNEIQCLFLCKHLPINEAKYMRNSKLMQNSAAFKNNPNIRLVDRKRNDFKESS